MEALSKTLHEESAGSEEATRRSEELRTEVSNRRVTAAYQNGIQPSISVGSIKRASGDEKKYGEHHGGVVDTVKPKSTGLGWGGWRDARGSQVMGCRALVTLGRRRVNGVNAVKPSFGICRHWERRPASSERYEQAWVLSPALVKLRPNPDGRSFMIVN